MVSTDATRRVATVFGGSGFLGRYIVKRLAQRGYVVRVAVRDPEAALDVALTFPGIDPSATAGRWTYGPDAPDQIVASQEDLSGPISLPASSITLLEVTPA